MSRIILLIIFSVFALNTYSQELNAEFLNSLPDTIAEDFVKQNKANLDDDESKVINPNTRIKNLEASLKDAQIILKRVEADLEASGPDFNSDKPIERFGEAFFQSFQSTFLPINEPNIDPSYVLDVGDQLTIQLIGAQSDIFEINIKRNGTINVPEVGDINIAGLSLEDATNLLKKSISEALIGSQAYISLTEIRDVSVLVVGNINNPGMYTLSGASSPLALIYAAGGIDENGSYRNILHKRNNQLVQKIDLYDLLIKGNNSFASRLRSGDSLIISPKNSEIRITGGISNPGIYEIGENGNIKDIIDYLGISKNLLSEVLTINRYTNGAFSSIQITLDELSSFAFMDGDAVAFYSINPKFEGVKSVTLSGSVNVPGVYKISDNMRLSELLTVAGGYKENAYPLGGVLTRNAVKVLENQIRDKGYEALLKFIISSPAFLGGSGVGGGAGTENIINLLALIKQYEPSGRVVSEFNIDTLKRTPYLDRILENGDTIHIPAFSNQLYVFGAVMNPGASLYKSELDLKDYINRSGGFTSSADEKRVIVIAPNGEVSTSQKSITNIFASSDYSLMPGSVIYIPDEPAKIDGINLASAVAPIVSSFALSIASLNSLNN